MTDAEKLKHLFLLLDEAEELASQYTGGYSNAFFSAEEFHLALANSISKLKNGDKDQIKILWLWFAPTCSWDDFVINDGIVLGNKIFELLDELQVNKQ